MKVAFIHGDKKVKTGANYINNLIADKLKVKGVKVRDFYPTVKLFDPPFHLKGLSNILFFYSLLEHRYDILKYDIIHGTTYTPLPFLTYKIPVVSHFGSTTYGMLVNTPLAINLCKETKSIWYQLKKDNVINELNIRTRKPQRDIIDIEHYVALRATAIIATSKKVHDELVNQGVTSEKITIIHNAIEDYWFKEPPIKQIEEPKIVYIGRLGSDAFTYKLKGLDRLIYIYNAFPNSHKIMISITSNSKLAEWLKLNINNLTLFSNLNKNKIPNTIKGLRESILLIPSRYEGFSLSLIEGMSQGLIPISFPVGVAPEIITSGKNGFLINNILEARKYIDILMKDANLRHKMASFSYKTSLKFKADNTINKFINLYNKIYIKSNVN